MKALENKYFDVVDGANNPKEISCQLAIFFFVVVANDKSFLLRSFEVMSSLLYMLGRDFSDGSRSRSAFLSYRTREKVEKHFVYPVSVLIGELEMGTRRKSFLNERKIMFEQL